MVAVCANVLPGRLVAFFALACLLILTGGAQGFSTPSFTNQVAPALSLGWLFQGNEVNLIIEKTRPGHAAIGLGTGMSDADIILVETSGNVLSVKDCYLAGYIEPICTESQDWTTVESTISASGFKVEVKRVASTSQPNDKTYALASSSVIFSYTDSPTVAQHSKSGTSDYGVKVIDFSTGVSKSKWVIWGNGNYMTHEHTQLILWSLVCDLLIFTGRYFKRVTRYFDAHAWPFLAVLIISLVMRDNNPSGSAKSTLEGRDFHTSFAVVVLVLSILILINGLFVRFLIEFMKNHLQVKKIPLVRKVHISLGILIWIATRICLFSGAKMVEIKYNGSAPMLSLIIETAVFLAMILGLEGYKWYSHKLSALQVAKTVSSMPQDASSIISDITSMLSLHELRRKYTDRNIFIFLDKVYDLGGYIHPGGHQIFKDCRFREVSRFIYGGVGYEDGEGHIWKHSADAFAVLNRNCIGELPKQSTATCDTIVTHMDGKPSFSQTEETWLLEGSKKISSTTSVIEFKALNKYQIKLLARGVSWIGRHYIVYGIDKARPYTNCTTLAKEYQAYQKSLIASFQAQLTTKSTSKVEAVPEYVDYLPLCIKEYKGPDALSSRLCNAVPGDRFQIVGPIGRGLEIPADYSGQVVMVAAGTGVLPFVDLLDFIMKKLMHSVLSKKGLSTDQIQPKQDYSSFFKGITWRFLGTFRTLEDFVAANVVETLHTASAQHEVGFFDALVKVSSGATDSLRIPLTKEGFNAEFLKKHIRQENGKWPLVLLCATPAMIASVTTDLLHGLSMPAGNLIYV